MKVHYKDIALPSDNRCLCGKEIRRKLLYSKNPSKVTCKKCLQQLRLYLSLKAGDTVVDNDKNSSHLGRKGVVSHIRKNDFWVVVDYNSEIRHYHPAEVKRNLHKDYHPYCDFELEDKVVNIYKGGNFYGKSGVVTQVEEDSGIVVKYNLPPNFSCFYRLSNIRKHIVKEEEFNMGNNHKKMHYIDEDLNRTGTCLCGISGYQKHFTKNPLIVTCKKCQAKLRPYFEFKVGDPIIDVNKDGALFNERGVITQIGVDDFNVIVKFDRWPNNSYSYRPTDIQNYIVKAEDEKVHYCIPSDKVWRFYRPAENVVLCDEDNTMLLNSSLKHTENVSKVTCIDCMRLISTTKFKSIMEENTVSENTVVTPDYQGFVLCKVDEAGNSNVVDVFKNVPSIVAFLKGCQLDYGEVVDILSGEDLKDFRLFVLKPVRVHTTCAYTVEEL
ncbi:MAG TPA: hypothetical protein VI911_05865 [Patescibacteria group bacterium]|nr:hypothetical protein [Patescibacteria group bacterium]